jgi:flagellar basal-body rod modification protein FlgD
MTAVTSTTSAATTTSTTSSSSSSSSSSTSLKLGTTDFLKLMMTQLENQNPLDPSDPDEYTAQLATYSQLEQQINTNDTLTTMSDTLANVLTQVQLLASES